uniref:T9SS type A sorting domain-containing protein n=1 Tax=candidate division WOR-3 bacterium TaxID=2052148 RepID=A0A7C4Y5M4_UNCW3
MRKLSLFLFILPLVFFAYTLNQNRYFITQDQGFFKLYRTMGTMAKNVDGKGIIWAEEVQIVPKFLLPDLVNKRLWFKVDKRFSETETLSFRKDIPSGSYTNGGFLSSMVGLELMDAYIENVWGTTTARILLSTSNGVYMSTNTGGTWAGQQLTQLPGYVVSVCASPESLTSSSLTSAMMYGLWNNGVIYRRTFSATSNWSKFADILYDYEDMEAFGSDPNVPPDWSRVNDDSNWVYRTSIHARSPLTGNDTTGLYSLRIYANNIKGNYYARYPLADTLLRKIIEIYVYFDVITGVPEYSSGNISIIYNGKKVDISLKNWGFSPLKSPDKIIDYFETGKWNRISVWCDFVNGKAIVYGKNKYLEVDMDTTSAGNEIRLTAPTLEKGYGFYIDDISIRPWIYDLVGHKKIKEKVYAATSDGIYRCDSTVWVKEYHYKGRPEKIVSSPYGNYYAFLDPEAKKVYFKDANWQDVTYNLPQDIDYYTIAIDKSGNLYLGTNDFVYRLIKGETNWTKLSNGFSNYGMLDYVKLIKEIAPISPETIYVANHNGVYVTFDGGSNWIQDNDGNVEPSLNFINSTTISQLDSIFEQRIYPIVTSYLGIPPDVDRDSVIHLVFMDVRDTLGDGTNGWLCSYWSNVNEYAPQVNPNSNKAEIIYVDYRSFKNKITATVDTMLFNLSDMVSWWSDNNEEFWVNKIFKMFLYHKYYYADGDNTSSFNFNLSISDDWSNDLVSPFKYSAESATNSMLSYALAMYLKGKYSDNVMKELLNVKGYKVVDPILNVRDSVILRGIEGLDTLLVRKGSSFKNLFVDFTNSIVFNKIPKLTNVTFESKPCTLAIYYNTNKGPRDITNGQLYLTSRIIRFDNSYITKYGTNIARFNGGNTNDFILAIVKEKAGVKDTSVQYVYLDGAQNPKRLYDIDLSEIQNGTKDNIYLIVNNVSTRGTDPKFATYFITQDRTIDTTVEFGIIRGPIADRYARLFLYSKKKLYSDVGSETPVFKMLDKTLNMAYFDTLKNGTRIYMADFVIPARADTIRIEAEDKAGNEYSFKYPVSIQSVTKGGSYEISGFHLYIPEGAFKGNITTITSKNSIFISEDFLKPVTLTFTIPEGMKNPVCYRMIGPGEYERIDGLKIGDVLQVKITNGGTYLMKEGDWVEDVNVKTGLVIFEVNPKVIRFSLNKVSSIELSLYDLSGRKIKTMEKGNFAPGIYEIENNITGKLPSGIYFVVLTTDFGNYSKKIVNIR